MRRKYIRTLEHLAEELGTDRTDEEFLSHRVYKATPCGAWLRVIENYRPERRCSAARFKVTMRDSILGPLCLTWQRNGRGPVRHFSDPATPQALLEYLAPYPFDPATAMVGPRKDVLKLAPDVGIFMRDVRQKALGIAWQPRIQHGTHTCMLTLDPFVEYCKPTTAIEIGSIVEGSDYELDPRFLAMPFTREQFFTALDDVNDEACAEWDRANLPVSVECTNCGDNFGMTEAEAEAEQDGPLLCDICAVQHKEVEP